MEAKASAKYLHGSPQKARLVIDMIRGKSLGQALAILQFTNKRAADPIEKCVRSAWANANEAAEKANIAVDPDELFVKAAFVDQGPTKNRRRVRPAPQGRAYREQRHFCHVTVLLGTADGATSVTATTTRGKASKKSDAPAVAASTKTATKSRKKKGGVITAKTSGNAAAAEKKPTTKRASSKSEAADTEKAQD